MLDGTRRDIVEVLLNGDASPTEIADELDLSLQTIHRHLQSLREDGYVRESGKRKGKTRPYKLYSVEESAYLMSVYDGKIVERSLSLSEPQKTVLSIFQVPQEEFHPVLLSYIFRLADDWEDRNVKSIAVYGSVARGDATSESDIDLLFITSDTTQEDMFADSVIVNHPIEEFENRTIVSNKVLTTAELREGIELGSQFLESALAEMIILYDPEDILRKSRAEYVR